MTDRIEALERLARLRAEGILSEDEFTAQKAALLAGEPVVDPQPVTLPPSGTERYLPWIAAAVLIVLLAAGAIVFVRSHGASDEGFGNAAGSNATALANETQAAPIELPRTPAAVPAPVAANQPDFMFTDEWLANNRPTWESLGEGPDVVQACSGATLSLTNATSKTMHLQGGVADGDQRWNIGIAQREQTIQFAVPEEPGFYSISSLDDGMPYAGYHVVKCDAQGNPE